VCVLRASLKNLHGAELGCDKHGALFAGVNPGLAGGARPLGQAFYRELFTRLSGEPGVRSVSLAMDMPFGGVSATAGVSVAGDAATGGDQAMFNYVGPRFFETMRIPLLAGRDFRL